MIPSKPKEILRLIQEIESKHESGLTELDHENLRVLSAHFEILNVPKCKTNSCQIDSKLDAPECPICGFTVPF